jgi:uncharacterized membrane protein
MLQKIARIYPPVLELIPLLLLFLAFYLTFINYPNLPDRIPSHFNIQGLPDGWGSKEEILIYPVSALVSPKIPKV